LAQAELEARLRQRVERRLRDARLGRFKPMADWEWDWPKTTHRPTVERVLSLHFLAQRENVIVVAAHGLGKTMMAKNLVHEAILPGHSARFLTAADLLFQVVSRRYEQKSIVITTNLAFKQWDTVFPNAACAVALIDRLTHHAEIISIDGEPYRKREAEQAQKRRQEQKPKR
jgi:DNA replication protein DnaC